MENYNYDFILPFFLGDDELRPKFKQIHKDENGFVYATNSHILIRLKENLLHGEYKEVEKYPNCEKFFELLQKDNLNTKNIPVNDLVQVLTNLKWVIQKLDCEYCEGEGTCECQCCGQDTECKKCGGTGYGKEKDFALLSVYLTEEESYSESHIKILDKVFRANYLHIITVCAKILGVDNIEYVYSETTNSALFKVGQADIILMPVSSKEYFKELKIK